MILQLTDNEILNYILLTILIFLSIIFGIIVYRKKKEFIANKLLSITMYCVGGYALSILIYKIINTPDSRQVFLRIGLILIMISVFCLFLTMEVLVNSSAWVSSHRGIIIFIIFLMGTIVLYMILDVNFMTFTDPDDPSSGHYDLAPFLLFAFFVAFLLLFSIIVLYQKGIKIAKDESKKRMMYFFIGLIFMTLALIIEAVGDRIEGLGYFIDNILFIVLSFGILIMAIPYLPLKQKR